MSNVVHGDPELRRVIDEEEIKKVTSVLTDDVSEMPKNWNRRFKHNREKIKTGDVFELAEGNVVAAGGVRALRFPWGSGHRVFVVDSIAVAALAARDMAGEIALGASGVSRVLFVDRDLSIREETLRVERTGERSWRLAVAAAGVEVALDLDPDGLPDLPGTERWPLEA